MALGPAHRPIRQMRNLGPRTESMLAEVDVHSEDDLRALGAVAAYQRLKFRFGNQISLLALYAMEAALTGQDWRELGDETKSRLRQQASQIDQAGSRM